MERKQLEDLIQRLWDQGASIGIMNILEHDKQQREALAQVEAELSDEAASHVNTSRDRDRWRSHSYSIAEHRDAAQAQLAEAVGLLTQITENEHDGVPYATIANFLNHANH